MIDENNPKPNYWWSMFHLRCPRCRRGDIFRYNNPYKKISVNYILEMNSKCPVCHQNLDLGSGTWFATVYIGYGVGVIFSGITFLVWWLTIGISFDDNRLVYWMIVNVALNFIIEPYFIRLSRWILISFFIHYDSNWRNPTKIWFS